MRRVLVAAMVAAVVGVIGCQGKEEPVAAPPPGKMPPGQQFGYHPPATGTKP